MSMKLIQTVTTTNNSTANINMASIPQDATDLVIVISARRNGGLDPNGLMNIEFNGAGNTATSRMLSGVSTSVFNTSETGGFVAYLPSSQNTDGTFSNTQIIIPDYAKNKTKAFMVNFVSETNGNSAWNGFTSSLWSSTSPITSININLGGLSFLSNSSVSLYKVTAGSAGGAIVS